MRSTSNSHISPALRQETANRCDRIPWLLDVRIGELRVYYEIADEPDNVVTIVAVGVKDRNRVLIGGREIEL